MASIKELGRGNWEVRIRSYNPDGSINNIKRRGFSTKKEAKEFVESIEYKNKNVHTTKLSDVFDTLISIKENNIRHVTKKRYHYFFNSIPFKDKYLIDINSKMILDFLLKYSDRPTQQTKLKSLLSQLFKIAITYYDFDSNFVDKINNLSLNTKKEITEKEIWTLEDFEIFDNILKNSRSKRMSIKNRTYFNLLYYTGARPGEISALKREDIDFENKTININKTRISENVCNDPKTRASKRIVSIPDKVMSMLEEYLSMTFKIKNIFLFNNVTVMQNTLKKLIKNNNLKMISPHGFRHSHASLLISRGVDVATVTKRLGHANSNITLSTYIHFYSKKDDKVKDLLDTL